MKAQGKTNTKKDSFHNRSISKRAAVTEPILMPIIGNWAKESEIFSRLPTLETFSCLLDIQEAAKYLCTS